MHARRSLSALGLLSCLAAASPALGLANRVFVSARSGNDANACDNITTPCQTFAGAVPKLNPGGEVIVLDSGGYGPVTINQSVTIEAPPGVLAFIHPPSGNAVTVSATSATVVLRGLTLNGGSGIGVLWFGFGNLHIENCVINGFALNGVGAAPSGVSHLFLKDTIIRGNSQHGILLQPSVATLSVSIDHCRVEQNDGHGVYLLSTSGVSIDAVVRDTVMAENTSGLFADATGGGSALALADSCSASQNATGFHADGAGAVLRVMASSSAHNSVGIFQAGSAVVETIGNNIVRGNLGDKLGTITIQPGD